MDGSRFRPVSAALLLPLLPGALLAGADAEPAWAAPAARKPAGRAARRAKMRPARKKAAPPAVPVAMAAEWRSNRFGPGPAQVILRPGASPQGAGSRIPRGSTVECILRSPAPAPGALSPAARVQVEGEPGFLFGDGRGGFTRGEGTVQRRRVRVDGKGPVYLDQYFTLRVPPGARLGPRSVLLRPAKGKVLRTRITVCQPLVVMVDLAGMRLDVFYELLLNRSKGFSHIARLAGEVTSPVNTRNGLKWIEFQHGLALRETATVFPTGTVAGQASLFGGAEPGTLGIAGDDWFDRLLGRHFRLLAGGAQGGREQIIAQAAQANARLRAARGGTLYDSVTGRLGIRSAAHHSFTLDAGDQVPRPERYPWGFDERGLRYAPAAPTDTAMSAAALAALRERHDPDLGLVTFYYAGLQPVSKERASPPDVADRQSDYLFRTIDGTLGRFVDALPDALYKSSSFIFTADHGQTDAEPRDAVHRFSGTRPDRSRIAEILIGLGYLPPLEGAGEEREGHTAVLGLNGGMAHVYLRRLRDGSERAPGAGLETLRERRAGEFEEWSRPARFEQVAAAAQVLRDWSEGACRLPGCEDEEGLYRGSLDLILVRDTERGGFDAPYEVYLGEGQRVPFEQFLRSDRGREWMREQEWSGDDRDAAFLAARLRGLQGPMSGDLILIPRYPEFSFDGRARHGGSGSLRRSDFEVPLVVLRPGEKSAAPVVEAVTRRIRLAEGKDRPMTTDVREVVIGLLASTAAPGGTLPAGMSVARTTPAAPAKAPLLARAGAPKPPRKSAALPARPLGAGTTGRRPGGAVRLSAAQIAAAKRRPVTVRVETAASTPKPAGPRMAKASDVPVTPVPLARPSGPPAALPLAGSGAVSPEPLTRLEIEQPRAPRRTAFDLAFNKDWEAAETAARAEAQASPEHAASQALLGFILLIREKHAEAEAAYRTAARLQPEEPEHLQGLQTALSMQRKWTEAEAACRDLVRMRPATAAYHDALGIVLFSQKQWAAAEAAYREAIRLDRQSGAFWANLAAALLMQDRRPEALDAARAAQALGEKDHWVYRELRMQP